MYSLPCNTNKLFAFIFYQIQMNQMKLFTKKTIVLCCSIILPFVLNAQTYSANLTSVTGSVGSGVPAVNSTASGTLLGGTVSITISETSPNIVFEDNYSITNSLCNFNTTSFSPYNEPNTDAIAITMYPAATTGSDSVIVTFSTPVTEVLMFFENLDFSKLVFPSTFTLTKIAGISDFSVNDATKTVSDATSSTGGASTCAVDALSTEGLLKVSSTTPFTRLAYSNSRNNPLGFGDTYLLNFGLSSSAVLPIKLSSFTAQSDDCGIYLQWKTESETDFDRFEVEQSNDGVQYQAAATISAKGFGSSYSKNLYNLKNGNWIVRLKMIDKDGKYTYSEAIKLLLDCNNHHSIQLYPNPISGSEFVLLNFNGSYDGIVNLNVYNISGELMYTKQEHLLNGHNSIRIDLTNVQKGNYFVRMVDDKGELIEKALSIIKL